MCCKRSKSINKFYGRYLRCRNYFSISPPNIQTFSVKKKLSVFQLCFRYIFCWISFIQIPLEYNSASFHLLRKYIYKISDFIPRNGWYFKKITVYSTNVIVEVINSGSKKTWKSVSLVDDMKVAFFRWRQEIVLFLTREEYHVLCAI